MYLAGILTLLVTSLSEVALPKICQLLIDHLIDVTTRNQIGLSPEQLDLASQRLRQLILILVVAMGMGLGGRIGWRQFMARKTHDAGYQLKHRFWDVLRRQPLSLFHRYTLGDLFRSAWLLRSRIRFGSANKLLFVLISPLSEQERNFKTKSLSC